MPSKARLLTLLAADLVLVGLVFCFTPAATAIGIPWVGYDWNNWHPFVLPHLGLAACLALVACWHLAGSPARSLLPIIVGWGQPLLAGTHVWAMRQWPGGDDGGGMSWLLVVAPVTAATLIAGAFVAAGRPNVEPRAAAAARRVFSFGIASGFALRAALPWLGLLFAL